MAKLLKCGAQWYFGMSIYVRALQVWLLQLMLIHDISLGICCGVGNCSFIFRFFGEV